MPQETDLRTCQVGVSGAPNCQWETGWYRIYAWGAFSLHLQDKVSMGPCGQRHPAGKCLFAADYRLIIDVSVSGQ
jgi:hypothetical protein